MIIYPKKLCWHCPKGFHKAQIISVNLTSGDKNKSSRDEIKIVLELTSLKHPFRRYAARKLYRSIQEFVDDFTHLKGEAFVEKLFTIEGQLIEEALSTLQGAFVDIEMGLKYTSNHEEPLRLVTKIKRSGELTGIYEEEA